MILVDTHCHLTYEPLLSNIKKILENSKKAGVKAIIANNTNPESNRKILELAEIYKSYGLIKPALGFYPTEALALAKQKGIQAVEEEVSWIKSQLKNPPHLKPVALGEIGMDFLETEEKDKKVMESIFEKFIELGEKTNIPLIIHSRKAEFKVVEMLESSKIKKAQFHYFMGRKSLMKRILERNWFISIPTNITRNRQLQENASFLPLSNILTETDAPWCSPNREDEYNEPKNILHSVKKIAELKNMDEKEVSNILFMNYQKLFL